MSAGVAVLLAAAVAWALLVLGLAAVAALLAWR
jgi:hypothetical protein